MAVTKVKTWVAEILTASDLNAEFDNIYNNQQSLGEPRTAAFDLDGQELILDSDGDSSITADSDDVVDIKIAGTDSIFLGHGTGNTVSFVHIDPVAHSATASTNYGIHRIGNSNAITIPAGTTSIVAGLYVEAPNLTATGTITVSATVYIEGPATEATTDYALWVDAGNVLLDGDLSAATISGGMIATQAEQETGSQTDAAVTPGRQQFHQSAAKGWVNYDQVAPAIIGSYNVSSVTDSSAGDFTVNWSTDFSDALYCVVASAGIDNASPRMNITEVHSSRAAGTSRFVVESIDTLTKTDTNGNSVAAFGDQ